MQNKPNSQKDQINATLFAAKDYKNKWQRRVRKNKPKTNPIQTQTNLISEKPKMTLNFYSTKDYDNKPPLRPPAKQTQFKPNSNPIPARRDTIRDTQYAIRHTTYEIRDTKYEIRNTQYAIRNTNPIPPVDKKRHTANFRLSSYHVCPIMGALIRC